jgi:2-polyprenyl-6-methoxyphenol hydroxylase-like FAD-dependent oxidoreductase
MAERWQRPGLLLLGDAAHPMSPVRAQGINMALRDSQLAASELASCSHQGTLDQAAERIETRRRPEIRRMQHLQTAEAWQGHLVSRSDLLRGLLSGGSPLLGPLAKRIWQARQVPMREGIASALPANELFGSVKERR